MSLAHPAVPLVLRAESDSDLPARDRGSFRAAPVKFTVSES